ncbi:MAG: CBS domain-containing protein [Planctomycetes bacterium]|nr:CBS domain-containing protein [Planctomycetota bacterium]
MRVRDLLAGVPLRKIHRNTVIAEVAGILDSEEISGAPLIDDSGEVVGLVSKSDIVHFEFIGGDPYQARVWEIGRTRLKTIAEDAKAKEAAQLMLMNHIHRLLVVDADGSPVGMLTSFDFVRHVAES